MSVFNIVLLAPGYQRANSGSEAATQGSPDAMRWTHELPQQPWQLRLCELLGVGSDNSNDVLPTARLLTGKSQPAETIVCADPIHLRADRDTATLLPAAMLNLRAQETQELLDSLNAFVAEDGWVFSCDENGAWYLQGLDGSSLASYPPSFLAHRNASSFLPDGEDSEQWRRLMAELQMLLHTHPVNQAREQRGQLPVNSLWFWGGGELPLQPESVPGVDPVTVFADEPFAVALCGHLGVHHQPLDAFDPLVAHNAIVVDTRLLTTAFAGDEQGMQAARQRIDDQWLQPASQRIESMKSGVFQLLNEDGDSASVDISSLPKSSLAATVLVAVLRIVPLPERLRRRLKPSKLEQ